MEHIASLPLPATIEAYVAGFEDKALARLTVLYAEALNLMDENLLVPALAPDVTMGNQTQLGFSPLRGASAVTQFIEEANTRCRRNLGWVLRRAELTWDPQQAGPAIRLLLRYSPYGQPGLGSPEATVTLKRDDQDRIMSIFTAECLPTPEDARSTGLFPGVPPDQLRHEIEYQGPVLSGDDQVEFEVFCIHHAHGVDETIRAVETFAARRTSTRVRLLDLDNLPDDFVPHVRVLGAPTVHLIANGKLVRVLTHSTDTEGLHAWLVDLFVGD